MASTARQTPSGAGPRQGGMHRGPGIGRKIEKARDTRGTFLRLLTYLHPYRLQLFTTLLLVLLATGLGLLGPYLLGRAIDLYIVPGDLVGLASIVLLMAGVYLGSWAATSAQGYIMTGIAQRALLGLRRDLFEHLQTLSLSLFDRRPVGEVMSRLTNDIDTINQVLSQSVTQLIGSLTIMAGILVIMLAMNVWLALGSLLVFPLMIVLTLGVGKRTLGGFRGLQMQLGQLNGLMEETLSGQRVVQAFGREEATIAKFDIANSSVRDAGIQAQSYAFLLPPMMGILSNVDIAIVAGLGGWLVLQELATVGTIATFISYARKFGQPLRQIADLYNTIQSALAGAERVFEILDEKPELVDSPSAVDLATVAGEVVFDHVDFCYVPGVPILKDVSLRAEPGQTVALVGPTGAGKTTIVNLLTRFYDIQGGAIRVDGHDIRELHKDNLRRQLGIVLQDTYLFSDTVLANIRYGRLDASDEECMAAAELANADGFIRRLPQGYQTTLSERASNLSQGQRQLLAIARAVLADPDILVLDEATSSVDTRTELTIQHALLRLMEGRTSFVIAHRLSTIRDADQLLVIDGGRIVESGTHESLLAQRGFYHDLYLSQFKGQSVQ